MYHHSAASLTSNLCRAPGAEKFFGRLGRGDHEERQQAAASLLNLKVGGGSWEDVRKRAGLANQEGSQNVTGEGRQLDALGALNSSGA